MDPGPAGPELAEKYGVPLPSSLADLFATETPDGIILATPNRLHVDGGLECVADVINGAAEPICSGRVRPHDLCRWSTPSWNQLVRAGPLP